MPSINHARCKRDFVYWSESEIGFYVDQHWDDKAQRWIKKRAPIVWDDKHRRLFSWALAIGENGRLPLSELWMIDIGKSAKSLSGAAVAEWFGMYVDRDAEIQLAANAREHAAIRVYGQLINSLDWSPHGGELASWIANSLTFMATNNIVRPVAMRGASVSGGNAIFQQFDEIWAYAGDRARNMMAEMKESPTRNVSFTLITSYPPFEGDDGPLNDTLNAFFDSQNNPREHIEQVEGLEDLPLWLNTKTGVAVWWNHDPYPWHLATDRFNNTFLDRQRQSYKDKGMLNEYLRIWEARRVTREDSLIPEDRWDACEDLEFEPAGKFNRNTPMVVALDAGWKGDSAGATARAWNPVTQKWELRAHKIWYPGYYRDQPAGNILLDMQEWVVDLNQQYNVLAVGYDPTQLVMMAAELEKAGIKTVEVNQNSDRAAADTYYRGQILSASLRNYPCAILKQHVMNAVAIQRNNGTIKIDKRKTTHQIDLAVADSMCLFVGLQYKTEFERLVRRKYRPPMPRRRLVPNWNTIYP